MTVYEDGSSEPFLVVFWNEEDWKKEQKECYDKESKESLALLKLSAKYGEKISNTPYNETLDALVLTPEKFPQTYQKYWSYGIGNFYVPVTLNMAIENVQTEMRNTKIRMERLQEYYAQCEATLECIRGLRKKYEEL